MPFYEPVLGADLRKIVSSCCVPPGSRENCLFVGPGNAEAAVAAAKLPHVRAYVVAEPGNSLASVRALVERAGQHAASVAVREGSVKDTGFPDCFFHVTVAMGPVTEDEKRGLLRVTRLGGKLLLGDAEMTRPPVGAEWPMSGGHFYRNTAHLAYSSPDMVIKPLLKLLWVTRLPGDGFNGGGTIVAGGRVYFVPAYKQESQPFALDAFTGEVLRTDLPGTLVAAWNDLIFVMRCKGRNSAGVLRAVDFHTLQERWATGEEVQFAGIRGDRVFCRRAREEALLCFDAATGRDLGPWRPDPLDLATDKFRPASTAGRLGASSGYARSEIHPVAVCYDWCHDLLEAREKQAFLDAMNRWASHCALAAEKQSPLTSDSCGLLWGEAVVGLAAFGDSPAALGHVRHARFDLWEKLALPALTKMGGE